MKKYIPIIIVIILIIGFLVLRKNTPITETVIPVEDTSSDLQTEDTSSQSNSTPMETKPSAENYSYTNEEFGFAMNLPGYTVTQKDRTKDKDTLFHPMVFTFGKTGSNEPNRMAVYIWNNPSEFDLIVLGGTNEGKVTVNGKVFDKYKIVDGDITIYRYSIKVGNSVYDVGVNDTNDISRFYLLK